MKTRVLIFCGIVLAICAWLLLHKTQRQPKIESPELQRLLTNQHATSQPIQSAKVNPMPAPPPNFAADAVRRGNLESSNEMKERELAQWQGRIDFYGKVVDDSSNPVSGATASFHWVEKPTEDGNRTATMESDSEGLFALHDQLGLNLAVSVDKAGYYASRRDNDSFTYGSLGGEKFSPDPLNPVVFHLRKKGQGESLIEKDFPPGIGQIWQLHHDGTPIELDLLNGNQNVTGSGQLKLEFWHDVSNPKANIFDWKLQLSVPDGGLILTDEEFAFQARENGYQSPIVIDMPATNQDWVGTLRVKYYIQMPDGKYGRIDFYLLPYNGVFTVHSAINPSGSRNLEPAQ